MIFTVFAGLVFHLNEFAWNSTIGFLNTVPHAILEVRALKVGLRYDKFIFKIRKKYPFSVNIDDFDRMFLLFKKRCGL